MEYLSSSPYRFPGSQYCDLAFCNVYNYITYFWIGDNAFLIISIDFATALNIISFGACLQIIS